MNYRIYAGLALLLVVAVFIVQNAAAVEIRFLFWNMSMSRSLMVFFVLAIGVLIGWISAGYFHKRRRQIPDD